VNALTLFLGRIRGAANTALRAACETKMSREIAAVKAASRNRIAVQANSGRGREGLGESLGFLGVDVKAVDQGYHARPRLVAVNGVSVR